MGKSVWVMYCVDTYSWCLVLPICGAYRVAYSGDYGCKEVEKLRHDRICVLAVWIMMLDSGYYWCAMSHPLVYLTDTIWYVTLLH